MRKTHRVERKRRRQAHVGARVLAVARLRSEVVARVSLGAPEGARERHRVVYLRDGRRRTQLKYREHQHVSCLTTK